MTSFDTIAGWLELALVPLSLALLGARAGLTEVPIPRPRTPLAKVGVVVAAILLAGPVFVLAVVAFLARLAARWPASLRLAVPLAVLTALTVAQPFGVRVEELEGAAPLTPTVSGRKDAHTIGLLGLPVMRFALYEKPIKHLGLGECCPAQDTLRVRSSVALPGLLTNASDVTELHGDGVPSDWALRGGAQRQWDVSATSSSTGPEPDPAWRLKAGIVSFAGLLYWVAAAVGITLAMDRRRRTVPAEPTTERATSRSSPTRTRAATSHASSQETETR